jgi:hypothetical protein
VALRKSAGAGLGRCSFLILPLPFGHTIPLMKICFREQDPPPKV